MYKSYDDKNKLIGTHETIDAAMGDFSSKAFHNNANRYDVWNADNQRERGTIWIVYQQGYNRSPGQVGSIKRPD